MEPQFWLDRWKNNEIGFHQNDINPHLREHWPAVNAAAGGRVFVPLAGKSKDMLWLAQQGYRVLGIEISPIAVEAFFTENGLEPERTRGDRFEHWQAGNIELLCGDYFDLERSDLEGVTAVFDRASLIALPVDLRRRYARHMQEILGTDVPIVLVTMEYPEDEMNGPPHSVHENEVQVLYAERYRITRLDAVDVLRENPHLRGRGLTTLQEKVYLLVPRGE